MDTFGSRLKLLRNKKGWTGTELGKKVNVTKVAVSKWESNLRFPDQSTLRKLSEIFNVSIDYLLCKEQLSEKEKTIKVLEDITENTLDKAESVSAMIIKRLIEENIIGANGEMSEQTKEMIFNAIKLDAAIQNKKGATKK